MNHPLLAIRDLAVGFDSPRGIGRHAETLTAVEAVDLELFTGECLALVGESGCGKSTLARAIVRLVKPSRGQIQLDGVDLGKLSGKALKSMRKQVQIVFQDPYGTLSPRRRIEQILREPLDLHRIGPAAERDRRVDALLATVGLGRDARARFPHEFSGGQRQRIAIARALAVEPKLIVADEPVSSLDVGVRSQILNLLGDLKRDHGISLLLISHDLVTVRHLADRVAVMYAGRIVEQADVDAIFSAPAHPYTRALLAATARSANAPSRARLDGEPPSPFERAPGCRFAPRCPERLAQCPIQQPRTIRLSPPDSEATTRAHTVACHLHESGDNR